MSGFKLNLASLQRRLGDANYARAQELYILQGVHPGFAVNPVDSATWQLVGKVRGSFKNSYDVEIETESDEAGVVHSISGTCDCPAPKPCKHMGALLIKAAYASGGVVSATRAPTAAYPVQSGDAATPHPFFNRPPPPPPPPPPTPEQLSDLAVDRWLDLFAEESGSVTAEAADHDPRDPRDSASKDQGIFILSKRMQGQRELLEITCQWAKPLKRGGLSRPRDMGSLDPSRHPADIADVMRLVMALPRSANAFSYYANAARGVLSGNTGMLAMRLASATGHLYWHVEGTNPSKPLIQAPNAPLQWRWAQTRGAISQAVTWHLEASVAGRPLATVQKEGLPVWLDPEQHAWGEIDRQELSEARLQALLNFPPIAESSWHRHEAALMRQLAGLPLPPIANPPLQVRGINPSATLRITPSTTFERALAGLATAQLVVDYRQAHAADTPVPDHLLPLLQGTWPTDAAPLLLSSQPDGDDETRPERVLLYRDKATESAWHASLQSLGLVGDRQGRFRSAPGLSVANQPWLVWAADDFAALRGLGFEVDASGLENWVTQADGFAAHFAAQDPDDEAASQWFDLSLGIEVAGLRVNVLPVLPALVQAVGQTEPPPYVYLPHPEDPENRWLRVETAALAPWVNTLIELLQTHGAPKGDSMRLLPFDLLRMGADLGEGIAWSGAKRMREMLNGLRNGSGSAGNLPDVPTPAGITVAMRPYQQHGLNWLQFLRQNQLGGVLADDMGLGKTLQTLAHLLVEKEAGRLQQPALIVCPVSVLGNWRREAAQFAPSLRLQIIHGLDRHAIAIDPAELDIVVIPYSLLFRDRERWLKTRWSVLVLDEAQHIKNSSTQSAQVAHDIRAGQRLCLSGTPLENHLGELWSLFHFIMPGFLGAAGQFKSNFRTPIEQHGDTLQLERLRRRVTPFILRRNKSEVAVELPDKIETVQAVTLAGKQADLYETIRLATEASVRDALAVKGLARSQIQVLDALLKLRQVCCDPRLVPTQRGKPVTQSAKLEALMELLPQLVAEGRRVLVFSQFTSMLSLIEEELHKENLTWVKLTGSSQNREELIARFTNGEVPIFLISLKAGGVGLNLQRADTVIHYDPWWNPAVENQATDRAHRLGQTQQVMVYKLVAEGTIEERMLALQARKAALAQSILSGSAARKEALFTEGDLQELLKPLTD